MSDDSQIAAPISLNVRFLSDWHVGEGAGRPGNVDRIVRRHPIDNLPYIPAKTLIGIWRDACEQIATGLDGVSVPNMEPKSGTWQALVNVIFGDQSNQRSQQFQRVRPASIRVRPARFPVALRQQLTGSAALKSALTFVKPGVQLDPRTGQAADNCLRFEEVVRGGAALDAEVELDCESEHRNAMLALLWAGAQTVERLGAKRRRGLGRCEWKLDGTQLSANELLAILDGVVPNVPSPSDQNNDEDPNHESIEGSQKDWVRIPVSLTLLTPLVIPKQVVGNVVESLDYIPGTQLLGAWSRQFRHIIKGNVHAAVARGDVRVLNAYPDVKGNRGLPVPYALFHDKLSEGLAAKGEETQLVWNRLVEVEPQDRQLKQHRGGYLGVASDSLPPYKSINLQVTTHGAIDDLPQRPTSDVGGVYSYQAIPAVSGISGRFRTEIWIRKDLLKSPELDASALSLPQDTSIGIAKKDDYGHVRVDVGSPSYVSGDVEVRDDTTIDVTIWCLSTVLLREASLRNVGGVEVLLRALRKHFDESVTSVDVVTSNQGKDHLISAAIRTSRTEGWLASWQLPRPSFVGIDAGSCVRLQFTVKDQQTFQDRLNKLRCSGLGERRAEGFGEIEVNSSLLDAELSQLKPAKPAREQQDEPGAAPVGLAENDPGFKYAQQLEEAAWRNSIDMLAQRWVHSQSRRKALHWTDKQPENSQLGALRSIVSTLRSAADISRLKNWLAHLEDTANRREKWPLKARNALRELCEKPQVVWDWLNDESDGNGALPVATQSPRRVEELQTQFLMLALRLVLIGAVQTETREREKPTPDAVKGGN